MSLKIKEEVTKQINAKVLRVVEYRTWLDNIVLVAKKDGKIWMDEEDAEKTAFITPRGVYCYKIMPFSLNNVGATYMMAMNTIFHDMIHKEIEKSMPTGMLAKWKIMLSEFDIVYVTHKAIKGQALANHLVEHLVDGGYEPLKMYFPDEEVSFIREDIAKSYDGWRIFFDRVANFKGVGIGAILILEIGQHYPVSAKLRFPYTNNVAEYEACISGLKMAIDMNVQELLVIVDSDFLIHQVRDDWTTKNSRILQYLHHVWELRKRFTKTEFQHVPRIQNEFANALATLSSLIQHPKKNFIDHIPVKIHN
ncbi:uncharacterized protein [Nicotiana sylvestris]|uniref:uncharacterized protein n=1 Tax=Nicotiana sylvestris TaxID=4096 RepID=UPI00388CCE0F